MNELVLLDGGTGHMIKESGFKCDTEVLWASAALKHFPEIVKEVHESFAKAGSKIIFANTYSLHLNPTEYVPVKLGELIKKNVDIVSGICNTYGCTYRISIGPLAVKFHDASEYSGEYMKDGRATGKDVFDHYEAILGELDRYGFFNNAAFETIPTLAEVEKVIEALKKHPNITAAFLTVVPKDEKETAGGDSLIEIAKTVSKCFQIKAFGINCCSPELCVPIAKAISPHIQKDQSLIMKPNDGRKYFPAAEGYSGNPIDITKDLPELVANKVRYIGGCCTVGPDVIQKYACYIEEHKNILHRES